MLLEHGATYGKLNYIGNAVEVGDRSTGKLAFRCECGKTKLISLRSVVLGASRSCGKCSSRPVKTGDRFGDLQWAEADALVQPESQKKHLFRCGCGREKAMRLFTVFRGRAKTCGDCSLIKLDSGQSVHGFTYAGPTIEVHSGSSRKLEFRCKCGQIVRRRLDSIKHGSTCGKCFELHLLPGDPYKGFTYAGETPINIGPWSKERLAFRCRCGNVKHIGLSSITCGDVVSCTECYSRVFKRANPRKMILASECRLVLPKRFASRVNHHHREAATASP